MPDTATTVVRLTTAGDMLATVPSVLGFRPEDSLVLLCLNENNRVQLTIRIDLPTADAEAAVTAQICQRHAIRAARRVVAVVVSERDHTSLLDHVGSEMTRLSIPLQSFHLPAFTTGARWSRHGSTDTGTLPDPTGTVLAAYRVADGEALYASRDDIAAALAHDDPAAVARRAAAIDAALSKPTPTSEQHADLVRSALRDAHRDALNLTDQQVATLAICLSDATVRDAALATAVPATSALARAARQLWTCLTRLTPEPERAQPAVVAAYAAYMAGDGVTARTALDIARAADPQHLLARLLSSALDGGVEPARLAPLAHHDELGLRGALDEQDQPATAASTTVSTDVGSAEGARGAADHR